MEKRFSRGFTMGTFDKFHIGHLELLRRASEQCYYLTVGVIADREVAARKGRAPDELVHRRAAHLAEVSCVDAVVKVYATAPTSLSALWEHHKFDVLFVGDDWKDKIAPDPRWAVVVFPRTPNVSTTLIRGDVQFPLISVMHFVILTACVVALYPLGGIGLTLALIALYWTCRRRYGRIRVHDWLNRATDEPADWC